MIDMVTKPGRISLQLYHRYFLDARSVILLLRKSSILLFKGNNACFHPSMYVDVHGETDENLRYASVLAF